MAKKTSKSAESKKAQTASTRAKKQTAAPTTEATPAATPTVQQGEAPRRANLIVAQRNP